MFFTQLNIWLIYMKKNRKKLHYFGNQHIDSEVDNAVDLSIFEQEEIDDETWNKSLYIIDAILMNFKIFRLQILNYIPIKNQS
ncbi:hypothetical protein BSPWISOXPB_8256 [uncultured Gammaproteobacteria bacterium]|nr:hypothetical protein BSPWISOXPB_8256 [uncultured Gammaproteobacteria bacterium]